MFDTSGELLVMSVAYRDAGIDGVFMTDDDLPDSYSIFEYDGNGFRTLDYSPPLTLTGFGVDGIPFTGDDYTNSYERLTYDASGKVIRRDQFGSPGPDGVFLTSDDVLRSAQFSNLDPASIESTFANAGFFGEMCPTDQSNNGSIVVTVKNLEGNPVAGATVQLDACGAIQQTSAEGVVTLGGLTGSHDVHIFSDNHSWQSFICLAPSGELSLPVTLSKKVANPSGGPRLNVVDNSILLLLAGAERTGDFGADAVVYALINADGKVPGINIEDQSNLVSGIPRVTLMNDFRDAWSIITLPGLKPGDPITAELWAYR